MGTGELNARGNPAMDWHPIQGGVEILLVASCYGNRDKLRPGGAYPGISSTRPKLIPVSVARIQTLPTSVFITSVTQVESQASRLSVEEPEEIKTYQEAMLPSWKEKVGEHETRNTSHLRNINITRINRFYFLSH